MEDLVEESEANGIFRIRRRAFCDRSVYLAERDQVFRKCWLYAAHGSELVEPGSFVRRTVGGVPIVIVKSEQGFRAFVNACSHRGAAVCLEERGVARSFQCPYHGWTFDTHGALIGVPGEEAYGGRLVRADWGLRPLGGVESYRDMIFVCLSPPEMSLREYLGGATEYIDLVLDQVPQGFELVQGVQRYTINANWKLLVENSFDIYHIPTVHKRFVDYVRLTGGDPASAKRLGRALDLGGGHAVVENPPTAGRPFALWHPEFGEEARPLIEQLREEIERRVGPERAFRMAETNRNLFIFPNLVMLDVAGVALRSIMPDSEHSMEVRSWVLAPVEEHPALRRARLRNSVMFLGPGGFGTPDDAAILQACQEGISATPDAWSDASRGLHRDEALHTDETQIRAFWRAWRSYLSRSTA